MRFRDLPAPGVTAFYMGLEDHLGFEVSIAGALLSPDLEPTYIVSPKCSNVRHTYVIFVLYVIKIKTKMCNVVF